MGMDRPSNPFPGPRPFDHGEPFFGRKRETEQLFSLLLARRTVLLHAPPGTGKSSLINGGLVPRLRAYGGAGRVRRNFVVLRPSLGASDSAPESAGGALITRVRAQLVKEFGEHTAEEPANAPGQPPMVWRGVLPADHDALSLADLLAGCMLRSFEGATFRPMLVLVFDHFEALLTNPPDERERFLSELSPLLRSSNVWTLLALDDEHLGALLDYRAYFPDELNTTFRLPRLGSDAAREAITEPTKGTALEFPPQLAERIVEFLTGGKADAAPDPLELQVVCSELHDELSARPAQPGLLEVTGGRLAQLRDGFVREAVAEAACGGAAFDVGRYRRALRWLRDKYIVADRHRRLHQHDDKERPWVTALERRRVLRIVRRGLEYSELTHDRLVESVLALDEAERAEAKAAAKRRRRIAAAVIVPASLVAVAVGTWLVKAREEALKKALAEQYEGAALTREAEWKASEEATKKTYEEMVQLLDEELDLLTLRSLRRALEPLDSGGPAALAGVCDGLRELYKPGDETPSGGSKQLRERCLQGSGGAADGSCAELERTGELVGELVGHLADAVAPAGSPRVFAIARATDRPLEVAVLPGSPALYLRSCTPSEAEMAGVVRVTPAPAALSVDPTGHHVAWWSAKPPQVTVRAIRRPKGQRFSQHITLDEGTLGKYPTPGLVLDEEHGVLAALPAESGLLAVFGASPGLTLVGERQSEVAARVIGAGPVVGGVIYEIAPGGERRALLLGRPPVGPAARRETLLELLDAPQSLPRLCGLAEPAKRADKDIYFVNAPALAPATVVTVPRLIHLGVKDASGALKNWEWEGVQTLAAFEQKLAAGDVLLSNGRIGPWKSCAAVGWGKSQQGRLSLRPYLYDNAWFVPQRLDEECTAKHDGKQFVAGLWSWVQPGEAGSCTSEVR